MSASEGAPATTPTTPVTTPYSSQTEFGTEINSLKTDATKKRDLQYVLSIAYEELLLNSTEGSVSLKNYLYLAQQAVHALSGTMTEQLDGLEADGRVALALVTMDEAAASTTDSMYDKAYEYYEKPVDEEPADVESWSNVQKINEKQKSRIYKFFVKHTEEFLKRNHFDTNEGTFAQQLIVNAPTLDVFVKMDLKTTHDILVEKEANANEQARVHDIYAGILLPSGAPIKVPLVRKQILKSGLSIFVADELEKMGIVDLKDVDESFPLDTLFSNLDDKDYPYLRNNSTKKANKNDKKAFNAFKRKVLGATKDVSGSGSSKKEKEEVEATTTELINEAKEVATKVTELLDSVVPENSIVTTLLTQETKVVNDAITDLKTNNLTFADVQGIKTLSDDLKTLFDKSTASPDFDEVDAEPYESELDLLCGVQGGAALKALGIFLDDNETFIVPTRTILQRPTQVKLVSPALPFRTITERSANETSMRSFITSVTKSSFGTAKKTTFSASTSVRTNPFLGTIGAGHVNTNERTQGEANRTDIEEQEKSDSTEAFVSEFTFMPMKSFTTTRETYLNETASRLSEEATECLENITDSEGAKNFLKTFGSHIPMGNQTLGGIFVRTMKITSKAETSLSDLYSAASVQLSRTNGHATNINLGRIGKFSFARSSEYIKSGDTAFASLDGEQVNNSVFESNVTCHGPNAADQATFYKQLLESNGTWSVIDRGEPHTYFAIWDYIAFLRISGYETQCQFLKAQWRKMALDNYVQNPRNRDLLLDLWNFPSGAAGISEAVSAFIKATINCLVPVQLGVFDIHLATQFEQVVKRASAAHQESAASTLIEFIDAGFTEGSNPLFRLAEETPEYELASAQMFSLTNLDFQNLSEKYQHEKENQELILAKAEDTYLVNLCNNEQWLYFKKLTLLRESNGASDVERSRFNDSLNTMLRTPDNNKFLCIDYLISNQEDDELLRKILIRTPELLMVTGGNSEFLSWDIRNDHVQSNGSQSIKNLWNKLTLFNVACQKNTIGNDHNNAHAPSKAVNGDTEIGQRQNSFISDFRQDTQNWEVNLGHSFDIELIKIFKGADELRRNKLMNNFKVEVFNETVSQWVKWDTESEYSQGVWTFQCRSKNNEDEEEQKITGDKIKISRDNRNQDGNLFLAEVEVYSRTLRNVAFGKIATQSSNYDPLSVASNVVDGLTRGVHSNHSNSRTSSSEEVQSWEVDLDGFFTIESIHVYGIFHEELNEFKVEVIDNNGVVKHAFAEQSMTFTPSSPKATLVLPMNIVGNKVKISRRETRNRNRRSLALAQVQVLAFPELQTESSTVN